MKYLVMEIRKGYCVLLDEEGRFWKAADLRYEVGQTVTDPVLMKQTSETVKKLPRVLGSAAAAVAACFLLLFGSSYYYRNIAPYASIYLVINPEVRIELNRKGEVVRLSGVNADGETLLQGYDGRGKDKVAVSDELIELAIQKGFLSEGGQVSFSIDAPDEVLFQNYDSELRSVVTSHLAGKMTITITITDSSGALETADQTAPSADSTVSANTAPTPTVSAPSTTAGYSAEPTRPATSVVKPTRYDDWDDDDDDDRDDDNDRDDDDDWDNDDDPDDDRDRDDDDDWDDDKIKR